MKQKHEGIRVFPTIDQFERLEAQRDTLRTQNARLVAALRECSEYFGNATSEEYSRGSDKPLRDKITALLAEVEVQP